MSAKPKPTPAYPSKHDPSPKPKAPAVGDFGAAYQRLPPRQKLYVSLGLFTFALCGVIASYRLEEAFPAPKPQTAARSKIEEIIDKEITSSGSSNSGSAKA